jgi:RNA polymerase sigma-70 factor, ECF subfamily
MPAALLVAQAVEPRPAILAIVEIDAEQCLVRAADGDARAFADLYDATAPRVFGLVLRILVDRSQAEEVAQEVYLEAWRSARRFDPARGAAISWLLQIAHARAVDRVRSSQAQRDRDARIGVRDAAVPVDEVAEHVEVALESARARRALAELSDVQRQAIELAYFGGLTQTEIAARLETPLGTVKTRMRDGMHRLREILGVTT